MEMILGDGECQFLGRNCHALVGDMMLSHQKQYSCGRRQQHESAFFLFLAANWRLEIL